MSISEIHLSLLVFREKLQRLAQQKAAQRTNLVYSTNKRKAAAIRGWAKRKKQHLTNKKHDNT